MGCDDCELWIIPGNRGDHVRFGTVIGTGERLTAYMKHYLQAGQRDGIV